MIRLMRQRGRTRRASATVEAALLLPLLTLLALGIIDVGRFSYAFISVATAARNGAQYGSKSATAAKDKSGIAAAARLEMALVSGYTSSNPTITSNRKRNDTGDDASDIDAADGQTDYSVKVKVTFQFSTIVPYPLLPNTLNISRTVHLRVSP